MKLVLFLLSACAVVVVLASPHNIHVARRHAIAARAAAVIPDDPLPLQKRQSDKRRCKNRSTSSVNLSHTPALNAVPATSNPAPSTTTPNAYTPVSTTSTTPRPPADTPTPRPTTTTPQPSNNNLPSFMSGVQTGQGTFYDAGLGACGIVNNDSDFIVAVSWRLFDNYPGYNKVNPNNNPICGKRIRATYQGKSTTVTVTDRCADDTCLVSNLDFSRVAFAQLASFDVGRLNGVNWEWV